MKYKECVNERTVLYFTLWVGPREARKGRGLCKRDHATDGCTLGVGAGGCDGIWLGRWPMGGRRFIHHGNHYTQVRIDLTSKRAYVNASFDCIF